MGRREVGYALMGRVAERVMYLSKFGGNKNGKKGRRRRVVSFEPGPVSTLVS